ncbi:hypothetical protein E3N88_26027 [Mikania micrantha]|uniref:Uncharacterized protein n=1 Tax=Mikania micrantha TaxID=192012 RepID=A0A5N6N974_9ASTR|nr:hypothetical protein E3N88_26027 [Mikania micrantha]
MMNVGENREQNGVRECPESKNEEKFPSIELIRSSRYAKDGIRDLGGGHIRFWTIRDDQGGNWTQGFKIGFELDHREALDE